MSTEAGADGAPDRFRGSCDTGGRRYPRASARQRCTRQPDPPPPDPAALHAGARPAATGPGSAARRSQTRRHRTRQRQRANDGAISTLAASAGVAVEDLGSGVGLIGLWTVAANPGLAFSLENDLGLTLPAQGVSVLGQAKVASASASEGAL